MFTHSAGTIVAVGLAGVAIIVAGALLSVYFGRKTTAADGWLAARASLPLPVVVITQFASAAGGGVLVAHVGIAYSSGWSILAYEACAISGLMVLSLIARWLREQQFTTIPDIINELFGRRRHVTLIAGAAALLVPFGGLCTQFVAFAKLFGQLTGAPAAALITLIAVGSVIFVLPGGLTSVAWTDFVFGIVKITLSVFIAGYAVYLAGGWGQISQRVPHELTGPSALGAAGGEQIWLWVAAVVPGTLTSQIYYQRVFATKHIRDARRGLILASWTIVIAGFYAGCIGLAVRSMNPDLAPENAAGWLLTRLPSPILVLFGAFLVATIVSVTAAQLHSVVANLSRDVYQTALGQEENDSLNIRVSRILTIIVAIVAGGLALVYPNALAWIVGTYAYSAAVLAAPIFGGYLLRRRYTLRPGAALASMVAGAIGCAAAQAVGTKIPYVVFGIATSALLLLLMRGRPRLESTAPTYRDTAEKKATT